MRQITDSNSEIRRGGGNSSRRKKLAGITASVLAVAMLLTGTFAWSSISQRATNPIEGFYSTHRGGRIHDHFDGENKDVFAENFGSEPLLVRIQLREFMQVLRPGAENPTIFGSGALRNDPLTWDIHVPTTRVDLNNNATNGRFRNYVSWTMGGSTAFMPTDNQDPNCLRTDTSGDGIDYYEEGVDGASGTTATGDNDGRANFWTVGDTITTDVIRVNDERTGLETVEIDLTARNTLQPSAPEGINIGNGVILMSDWIARGMPLGNFWVICQENGWAYWASFLQPGQATSLLLDAISIIQPEGEWFYAIHVIGEFATAGSVGDWDDSPFGDPSNDGDTIIDRIINGDDDSLILGGYEWIILSTTMGPGGHGTGDDILLVTRQVLGVGTTYFSRNPASNPQLPESTRFVGGYYIACIRTNTLANFYSSQTWAHGLAIQPVTSIANSWTLTTSTANDPIIQSEITTSPLPRTMAGAGNVGGYGAFLLSLADVQEFMPTQSSRNAGYRWWLRSPNGWSSVSNVGAGGLLLAEGNRVQNEHQGFRPALLLTNLPGYVPGGVQPTP